MPTPDTRKAAVTVLGLPTLEDCYKDGSYLLGHVEILGTPHYLELVEVRESSRSVDEPPLVEPVDPDYSDWFETLARLCGTADFSPVSLPGGTRKYIAILTPAHRCLG